MVYNVQEVILEHALQMLSKHIVHTFTNIRAASVCFHYVSESLNKNLEG
jgi:hypothetical protein